MTENKFDKELNYDVATEEKISKTNEELVKYMQQSGEDVAAEQIQYLIDNQANESTDRPIKNPISDKLLAINSEILDVLKEIRDDAFDEQDTSITRISAKKSFINFPGAKGGAGVGAEGKSGGFNLSGLLGGLGGLAGAKLLSKLTDMVSSRITNAKPKTNTPNPMAKEEAERQRLKKAEEERKRKAEEAKKKAEAERKQKAEKERLRKAEMERQKTEQKAQTDAENKRVEKQRKADIEKNRQQAAKQQNAEQKVQQDADAKNKRQQEIKKNRNAEAEKSKAETDADKKRVESEKARVEKAKAEKAKAEKIKAAKPAKPPMQTQPKPTAQIEKMPTAKVEKVETKPAKVEPAKVEKVEKVETKPAKVEPAQAKPPKPAAPKPVDVKPPATTKLKPTGILKKLTKFSKVVPILGSAVGAVTAVMAAEDGYSNASSILGVDKKELTEIDKIASAAGAVVNDFTFGLVETKTTAETILEYTQDKEKDRIIETYAEKLRVIDHDWFGNSEITNWFAIESLKSEQVADILKLDDWSDEDKKRLEEIKEKAIAYEKFDAERAAKEAIKVSKMTPSEKATFDARVKKEAGQPLTTEEMKRVYADDIEKAEEQLTVIDNTTTNLVKQLTVAQQNGNRPQVIALTTAIEKLGENRKIIYDKITAMKNGDIEKEETTSVEKVSTPTVNRTPVKVEPPKDAPGPEKKVTEAEPLNVKRELVVQQNTQRLAQATKQYDTGTKAAAATQIGVGVGINNTKTLVDKPSNQRLLNAFAS